MGEKNVEAFAGCNNAYYSANAVLFGAPFDSTCSYRAGTRTAAKTMRSESMYGIETYSPYQDRDLSEIAVFDGGDLELGFGNPEPALDEIENFTTKLIQDAKIPIMLGGEHLVTLGAVRAIVKQYPDLHVIHFDAHTDLRDEFCGAKLSHATVLRRVWELTGDQKIYQFGIRSGDKREFDWSKDHVMMQKFTFEGLDQVIKDLRGKPVYFTLDLDVLDTSVFPGTGTPEPGGVSFMELLDAVQKVCGLNIVGCDLVELSPPCDQSGASTIVACKILRELLLALCK